MKLLEVIADDIEQFKRAFNAFINTGMQNQWLVGGDTIQVYVRKGHHIIGKQHAETLDIANIDIDENERGKGAGTSLIDWLHDHNPFLVTYVENVLNPGLYKHLKARDWLDVPGSNPPSVYKPKLSLPTN